MYKIILDSCGDLTKELKKDKHFCNVPLILNIDGEEIIDDDNFNQLDFINKAHNSPNEPKSACPAPGAFLKEIENTDAERIYIITISSKVSGSYNSALVAKSIFEDEDDSKKIYVFDSKTASVGETILALKIKEMESKNINFELIVDKINSLINENKTYFVLETLETFRKSGRLSGVKSMAVSLLNIVPIMSQEDGSIIQVGQQRGHNKAIKSMVERICDNIEKRKVDLVAIAHCNCKEQAELIKNMILKQYEFVKFYIVDTGGVSTMYANQGGIIVTV